MDNRKFITVDADGRVSLIHNMPFHELHGMGKSESELLKNGFLIDTIPEPPTEQGKIAVAMYDIQNGFYYKMEDEPLTPEQEILQRISATENALIAVMDMNV